jgi:predicted TIM-barrel fold metal-dependent hydrolase
MAAYFIAHYVMNDPNREYQLAAEPTIQGSGGELVSFDDVMWASDHPHGDSTWPHSRQALAASPLAQHGPEVLRKVTCENAARVYGFRL